jgi:pimeloyl-ACP methyl ester carboxylesterase
VLLIPGWGDRAKRLSWLQREFIRAGWQSGDVGVVDFKDRFGSNIDHAAEIAAAIDELRGNTDAVRVDVVAHSMGGLALRYYLHFHSGNSKVRRVVFTGTPHRGTWIAYLGWGKGAREMRPGTPLLATLSELPPVPVGVSALCIHTPLETRVLPQSSALLPDARHQRVWCSSHPRLLRSRKVFAAIRDFLLE